MEKDLLKNNPAVGISWEEARKELFTPEEIAASDLRVAIIGELIKRPYPKRIGKYNRYKTACYCQNRKRYYQSANSNYFKTARPARQNSCRCPVKTC